jgi:hypothetical protein
VAAVTEQAAPLTLPPLGLLPRRLWLEARHRDLMNTIQRYVGQGVQPDPTWMVEAYDLALELLRPQKPLRTTLDP